MISKLLAEMANGNSVVIAIAVIILWRWHKDAMKKLEDLTDAILELTKTSISHAEKLKSGEDRFKKIENLSSKQGDEVGALKERIATLEAHINS